VAARARIDRNEHGRVPDLAVEGEDRGVGRQAGEGLVDDRARDALALRVARDRGQESVEVAAAWRGERGGGEEQQDEGKEEAGLPHPRILIRKDPTSHPAGPKPTCKSIRILFAAVAFDVGRILSHIVIS
jgi:hypothetical protein